MYRTLYYIKKAVFTLFAVTFLLSVGATFTSVYTLEKIEDIESAITSSPAIKDVAVSTDTSVSYCVKAYNGIIGVYDLSGSLMYTVEVYIKTLPASDRALLEKGIYASSYGELLEILGDYTA